MKCFFIDNVVRLLSYVNMCAYHVYFTINLFTYLLVLTMAACSLHITQLNFSSWTPVSTASLEYTDYPQMPLSLEESGATPNAWFLAPTQVHNPNSISTGSAVFLWLMLVTNRQTEIHTHRPLSSWDMCSEHVAMVTTSTAEFSRKKLWLPTLIQVHESSLRHQNCRYWINISVSISGFRNNWSLYLSLHQQSPLQFLAGGAC